MSRQKILRLLFLFPLGFAMATTILADRSDLPTLVCKLVDTNNLVELKKLIKKNRIKKVKIVYLFECSKIYQFHDGDLVHLAISSGSYDVADYLIQGLSPNYLEKVDDDGLNVLQWADLYYADDAAAEAIIALLKSKLR